jgi:hypothetical protein
LLEREDELLEDELEEVELGCGSSFCAWPTVGWFMAAACRGGVFLTRSFSHEEAEVEVDEVTRFRTLALKKLDSPSPRKDVARYCSRRS